MVTIVKQWQPQINHGFATLPYYYYKKKYFSCFMFLNVTLYLNRTTNRNCKDKCVSHVSVRSMFFFNRDVFLMESTITIIIITKRDDLLLILNVLFNECL